MARSKILICICVFFLLAGCVPKAASPGDVPKAARREAENADGSERALKLQDDIVFGVSGEHEKNQGKREEEKESDIPQKSEAGAGNIFQSGQPEPPKGKKLDFKELEKIDNTKYAWWITMNSRHETPGIPSHARDMLLKYDGVYVGDTSKKKVYLTFDEGYENGYTSCILDTLKENGVKALFFVTGPYIKEQTQLVRRMLDEGHLVGSHSVNHPSLPALDLAALENELYGLEELFGEKYGKGFRYMRPPRGEYSERVLAAAKQLGYKTVFWSFAYRDFDINNQKGADYAHRMVMRNLHNGAVILLHAVSRDNAEALDRIIKDIKAQGYEISPFDL